MITNLTLIMMHEKLMERTRIVINTRAKTKKISEREKEWKENTDEAFQHIQ